MAVRHRYELRESEWEVIKEMLPKEASGRRGRPRKDNRTMINAMMWMARSGAPWRDLPERYGAWESVYSRFKKWRDDGILDNVFRLLAVEADLQAQSLDSTIVRAHQHSAGAKKGGEKAGIGRSRGGLSSKIHAVVDALAKPLYLLLSEGQESDSAYAINVLSHVTINGSNVLADRGYDADAIIDYIYEQGGEPTIPSKANRKFQRKCDWWLYKERHSVECFFQKLKQYRRIATRYDKLASSFMAFACIASIGIWLDCTV